MKIAVFVSFFPCLSETFILNQITGLLDRGHEVHVYAKSRSDHAVVHGDVERYDLGRRTFYYGEGRWKIPANQLSRLVRALWLLRGCGREGVLPLLRLLNVARFGKAAASLGPFYRGAALLKSGTYDIVHCQYGHIGQMAAILRAVGVINGKLITTFLGQDISSHIRLNGPNAYNFLFSHGDHFVAISEVMRDNLIRLGCHRDKIVVHRLGVDVGRFGFRLRKPKEGVKVRLLTVGRFVEKKGLEYAIRAVARVVRRYPEIEYQIVGDGKLRNQLTKLITELNVGGHVQLLGWRAQEEVTKLIDAADIFLAPSVTGENGDQEGTPTSIMEALARGLPVLSTLHSGIPEVVQDGESGFLVPERDAAALAEKLEYLARHPEIWGEMGKTGRAWVERYYDINKLNDQLIKLFERVLDGERDLRTAS